MGTRAAYRKRFLQEHPFCCFCGGVVASTTVDHIPSRATFNARNWPVGHDFPACENCNSSSAQHEQIVALLARAGEADPTAMETEEYGRLLQGLLNNQPEVLREMKSSANQIRAFLRGRGECLGDGLASSDVPVLSVDGPLVTTAVEAFARKLFLSMHYKHTGKIVPHTGGVAMKWITNATKGTPEFLQGIDRIRTSLPHGAEMKRARTSLSDQFSYEYFANEEGSFSAYFVIFRESFAMIGNVRTDSSDFPDAMREAGILKPYPPNAGSESG